MTGRELERMFNVIFGQVAIDSLSLGQAVIHFTDGPTQVVGYGHDCIVVACREEDTKILYLHVDADENASARTTLVKGSTLSTIVGSLHEVTRFRASNFRDEELLATPHAIYGSRFFSQDEYKFMYSNRLTDANLVLSRFDGSMASDVFKGVPIRDAIDMRVFMGNCKPARGGIIYSALQSRLS